MVSVRRVKEMAKSSSMTYPYKQAEHFSAQLKERNVKSQLVDYITWVKTTGL